jgi:hypothetical protein
MAPQVQRLQHLEADLDFLDRIGRQRNPDRVADPRPQQHAEPIEDLTVSLRKAPASVMPRCSG